MAIEQKLAETLGEIIEWNGARIKFLAIFIIALLQVQTVNLTKIANVLRSNSEVASNYRRIQRFLSEFEIKYQELAVSLVKLLPMPGPWVLTMDRTNWELGRKHINILMLAIVYKGVAWPVMWLMLDKKGNSNTEERKQLLRLFIKQFGSQKIKYLTADREFVGGKWLKWLKRQKVDFRIALGGRIIYLNDGFQSNQRPLYIVVDSKGSNLLI